MPRSEARPTPTASSGSPRIADRHTLVAVDLESLVSRWGCLRRSDLVVEVRQVFASLPRARSTIIAGNRQLLARLHVLPRRTRLRAAANGPGEAYSLLLHDLQAVPRSVRHVVIAGGDHAILPACEARKRAGLTVEVAARAESLSTRLARAADAITELAPSRLAIAA